MNNDKELTTSSSFFSNLRDSDMRLDALKMAWDGVGRKIFNPDTKNDLDPTDIVELYEIAEYNYRFIKGVDLDIDMRNTGEKVLQHRRERTQKIMQQLNKGL